jgi:hypothetical protein
MSECNSSITGWLKQLIEGFMKAEPNEQNNYEISDECFQTIIEGLKRLNEYVTWLQKAYDQKISKLDTQTLREQFADLAHKQWSGWMEYLFEKSTKNEDGTVTIPRWAVDRWSRQINTEYKDLSQQEQDSDRTEADKFLAVLDAIKKMEE